MITVYTICYNEKLMLPLFIEHYRKNFPDCSIVVYDNESTDGSPDIAKSMGCEVITYSTNNQISDSTYLKIKNSCWKNSKTKWNVVVDVDEWCQITERDLIEEDSKGTTLIRFSCYDMVNLSEDLNSVEIINLDSGKRNTFYDKTLFINREKVKEINYWPGCHISKPVGELKYQSRSYKIFHYKYIGLNFLIERYRIFNKRMSDENKINGWGVQYLQGVENIKHEFNQAIKNSIKLL